MHASRSILTDCDALTPIDRLETLIEVFSLDSQNINAILLALNAIDVVVNDLLMARVLDSSRNLYIYRDETIQRILQDVLQSKIDHRELVDSLILLNETDLIFRFTVARKFRASDIAAKQLRINSWGKLYIEDKKLVEDNLVIYELFKDVVEAEIGDNYDSYGQLVKLVCDPISPLSASEISAINDQLLLKLLS